MDLNTRPNGLNNSFHHNNSKVLISSKPLRRPYWNSRNHYLCLLPMICIFGGLNMHHICWNFGQNSDVWEIYMWNGFQALECPINTTMHTHFGSYLWYTKCTKCLEIPFPNRKGSQLFWIKWSCFILWCTPPSRLTKSSWNLVRRPFRHGRLWVMNLVWKSVGKCIMARLTKRLLGPIP